MDVIFRMPINKVNKKFHFFDNWYFADNWNKLVDNEVDVVQKPQD